MILMLLTIISTFFWIVLPGPVALAVTGTLMGGYLLKTFEIVSIEKTPETPALELTHDPEYGIYNGYVCPTWDYNRIERELGGTDFIPCENHECPACFEKGKCAVAGCYTPATTSWWPDSFAQAINTGHEWLCTPHFIIRDVDRKKKKAVLEKDNAKELARKKAEEAAWAKAQSLFQVVDGVRVSRPSNVPHYAHASVKRDRAAPNVVNVYWEWTDNVTGKQMGARSMSMAPEAFEIHNGNGDVVHVGEEPPIEPGGKPTWIDTKVERAESPIKLSIPRGYRKEDRLNTDHQWRDNELLDMGRGTMRCEKCGESLMRFPFKSKTHPEYHPDCAPTPVLLPSPFLNLTKGQKKVIRKEMKSRRNDAKDVVKWGDCNGCRRKRPNKGYA